MQLKLWRSVEKAEKMEKVRGNRERSGEERRGI